MRTINYRLHKKLEEVYFVEPNDLGFGIFTSIYHKLTAFLKTMPFIFIIPLSLAAAVLIYFVFGALVVKLASLLQYGF